MDYKYYLFKVPEHWNLDDCVIEVDKEHNIIIKKPVDHLCFHQCTSPILDGDEFKINEVDDWNTKAVIAAGSDYDF